jgi:hypothetical protein
MESTASTASTASTVQSAIPDRKVLPVSLEPRDLPERRDLPEQPERLE